MLGCIKNRAESSPAGVRKKILFFIVYNFNLKCLNSNIAAAFHASKRCGLTFN
jgi:hypothetical protein